MNTIENLRSTMHAAAERRPLPDRFTVASGEAAQAIVSDSETGRSTVVPLGSLGAVRNVLHDLFGDADEVEAKRVADERAALKRRIAAHREDAPDRADAWLREAMDAMDEDDLTAAADYVLDAAGHLPGPAVRCADCGAESGRRHVRGCGYEGVVAQLECDTYEDPGSQASASELADALRAAS